MLSGTLPVEVAGILAGTLLVLVAGNQPEDMLQAVDKDRLHLW